MKKLLTLLFAFMALGLIVSCSSSDDDEGEDNGPIFKSGVIAADEEWGPDQIVNISGRVIVDDGVTLTIHPGTIVKGAAGEGLNASVLMVARGGMIDAQGTAAKPIIMTTVLDDIKVGELNGTFGNKNTNKLWGGLVILGSAPISAETGAEAQIEGVPASETLGLYGGNNANDNSGILKYISIRFGGAIIDAASGSEINGLTLGGVGSGTTIDHVEVYANVDDGIEFFGGSVSVSDALVAFQGDDALDVDQAYSGTISNFMLLQDANSDEGLEIDGPEDDVNSEGTFTIQNGTIKSVDGAGNAADFKSRAQGSVSNVLFTGYTAANIKIRASYQNACSEAKSDAFTNLTANPATLTFATTQFDGVSVYTKSDDGAGTDPQDCVVPQADQTAAEAAVTSETATGASDPSAFTGWTLSSIKNEL